MAGNKGKRKQKDKNQERNYLQPVGSFFNEYVDKVLKKMFGRSKSKELERYR